MDGRPADSQVDSSTLRDGVPVDPDYSIFASPALVSITKGAIVRYTLLYEGALTTIMSIHARRTARRVPRATRIPGTSLRTGRC